MAARLLAMQEDGVQIPVLALSKLCGRGLRDLDAPILSVQK